MVGNADGGSDANPRRYDTGLSVAATIDQKSGSADSNRGPLVPQTSTDFDSRAEVDLECFRREMVGKSTSPCKLEAVGIACNCIKLSVLY